MVLDNYHIKQITFKLTMKTIVKITLCFAVVFVLFFVTTSTLIGFDVKSKCYQAQKEYGGSCTQSLIKLLNDKNQGFRARNSAIWALGQLGDSSALSVLESYYTGNIPNRESLDQTISQYELKKAIDLLRGGKNITAPFWRYLLN